MTAVKVSEVLTGIAEFLDGEGVGVWRPEGTYTSDEVAVTLKSLPAAPDNAVAVAAYHVGDDLVLPDVEVLLQLRFRAARGSRTAVDDLADSAFDVLHGRHMFSAGALTVQRARRLSVAPLGADDNGREERADNYALILMRS